jgi:hypothetical protein
MTFQGSQISSNLLGAPKQSSCTWCCAKVNKGKKKVKEKQEKKEKQKK